MPIITINTQGFGDIIVMEPDNLKLKMLMDALKDHVEIYGVDKLEAFFSGENTDELKNKISTLEDDLNAKEEEITELEDVLNEVPELEEIDCGIGQINYELPDNIALRSLMENLEAAIKKTTPRKVNEVLSNI